MTRFLLLLLCFLSWSVSAQTYVRPSKGNPITPFNASSWTGAPATSDIVQFAAYSPPYDWSAFDAVRLYIYTTGAGTGAGGQPCSGVGAQRYSYSVSGMGSYIKLLLSNQRGYLTLTVMDSATPAGTYFPVSSTGGNLTDLLGCNVIIQAIPLAFAPTETSVSVSVSLDGGFSVSGSGLNTCTSTRSTNTSVGTSATAVPADGGLSGRQWIRLCNSARNSGVPIITCTSDGTAPDAGLNGAGEALEVGDCSVYTTTNTIKCVSDSASTSVSSEECQ